MRRQMALSAEQRGLVTRAQLIACGRSERQIDYALTTARLTRVQFGVYRVAGTATVEDGDLVAGLLFTDGAASHRSAAHLLNLVDAAPSVPEILVGAKHSQRA